jgi:lipid-binding SYLF domain-containing protein
MSSISKWLRAGGIASAVVLSPGVSSATQVDDAVAAARDTVAVLKSTDPSIERFFKNAPGYVVFPTVNKGAFVVGGAGGAGILFEDGKPIGKTSIGQVTVGVQAGGQAYTEIIFFENSAELLDFKKGNFGFAAQVSAVALSAGAAANAKYRSGVAVFTMTKTGLMAEASVAGQWFHYEPFPACANSVGHAAGAASAAPGALSEAPDAKKPDVPALPIYCSPTS